MKLILVLVLAGALSACGDTSSPVGPSAIAQGDLTFAPLLQANHATAGAPSSGEASRSVAWACLTTSCAGSGGMALRASNAFTASPLSRVPSPHSLTSEVAQSTVTLAWAPSPDLGVRSYVVEAGSRAGLSDLARFDTGSLETALTVTGVPSGVYYVRVRAQSAAALSDPTNEVTIVVGTTSTGFVIELPIRLSDRANNAFGLLPFGVHIGDHGIDGHPGWDIEFAPGANLYAAASGTVQSVIPNGNGVGYGIQIQHRVGASAYRTIYGVGAIAPGIAAGTSVTVGQLLGATSIFTRTIGRTTVTYSFTHFQVDDFSSFSGITNQNAVPPERFLSASARQAADLIWRSASYGQELVEPHLASPRDVAFPLTRVWSLVEGRLAARMTITGASASPSGYDYQLHDAAGALVETGVLELDPIAKPLATMDLRPSGGGAARRGVYAVFEAELRIDYSEPGGVRPASLAGAAQYRTP